MSAIVSQTTSFTIIYSTVYSDANQSKHQSSASLASVQGIHRWPVNSPHKGPVTRKMFPFDDIIILTRDYTSLVCLIVNVLTLLFMLSTIDDSPNDISLSLTKHDDRAHYNVIVMKLLISFYTGSFFLTKSSIHCRVKKSDRNTSCCQDIWLKPVMFLCNRTI